MLGVELLCSYMQHILQMKKLRLREAHCVVQGHGKWQSWLPRLSLFLQTSPHHTRWAMWDLGRDKSLLEV